MSQVITPPPPNLTHTHTIVESSCRIMITEFVSEAFFDKKFLIAFMSLKLAALPCIKNLIKPQILMHSLHSYRITT